MSKEPKVFLHPNAVIAFDKEGQELVLEVEARPVKPATSQSGGAEFVPAATLGKEDIKDWTELLTDQVGTTLSKFREVAEQMIGLSESSYLNLRLLTEKIQRTQGFRDRVSVKALEDSVFDWVLDRHLQRATQTLCERIVAEFEYRVRELWVWVPVKMLSTTIDFDLGHVEVHPFRKDFFDTWEQVLKKASQWNEKSEALVKFQRSRHQGHAACTLRVVAEPIRAREIALAEAENALAILRMFQPCILHPQLPSHLRPFGRELVAGSECLLIEDDWINGVDAYTDEPASLWHIDEKEGAHLNECGMGALHFMFREGLQSAFERDLWRSIWAYSRSSLQKTPEDRLTYIFRALDSFLLQDRNESIQQNVADRIAFTIDDGPGRIEIVDTVKKAYGMRSDVVHHDQTIKEIDLMIEFLKIVFRFFLMMIGRRKEFKTRQDFFADVERKKYA